MDKLERAMLDAHITRLLQKAEKCFTPEMRLTFIARHPDNEDIYFINGSDTLDGVASCIEKARGEHERST